MNFINRPQHQCCLPPKVCCLPPKVRVVNKCCYRDVTHIQPCHTHIVNTQINRHRIVPQYTCSQEQRCKDVFVGQQCGCNW